MDKKCFKCGVKKPISEFYRHSQMKDGHLNKCKECTRKDTIRNRESNIEYYRKYDRERSKLPHRVEARKKYGESHKPQINEYKQAWRKRNPLKSRAHRAVQYNLSKGYITKEPCANCGYMDTEAHHEDYSKPLEIIWLCDSCHKARHKEKRVY